MNSEEATRVGGTYTLGHSDAEIQRLLLQGRIYNQHTANALHMAGLRPGMRACSMWAAAQVMSPLPPRDSSARPGQWWALTPPPMSSRLRELAVLY
jgi:hypothetical protein